MELKALLLAITILAVVFQQVEAEFYYNSLPSKAEELESNKLKCIPGRTVLKMQERAPDPMNGISDAGSHEAMYTRKSHMNAGVKEEYCKICICSVEGKDEYCSGRPARNVNECLRLTLIVDEFNKKGPYEHTRGLPFRVRRDYIWHLEEIPYSPRDKCYRSTSYYTNNPKANDTDIDRDEDIKHLLDYDNMDTCLYCVCAVHGQGVSCIDRPVWFCAYFRYLRNPRSERDMYDQLLKQDRPTYFRQISWRMRRTMDDGIYDFVETVGTNSKTDKCIPFVSQYTDCTEDNLCSGCNNCICVADGEWSCNPIKRCPADKTFNFVDEKSMDDALFNIERDLQSQKMLEDSKSKTPFVPAPLKKGSHDYLLDVDITYRDRDLDRQIISLMGRKKRSVPKNGSNVTTEHIKFYHTIDEINADTLKNDNTSGTIQAKKVDISRNIPKLTRRIGVSSSDVASKNDSLHIEFSEPKIFDSHIADNKIESSGHSEDKYGKLEKEKLDAIIGNHSLKQKDKELSKLIVNELRKGTEVIGDKKAPIMSNITFTPENDTLTAMAFIAGNLLNQLWNMEKDSSEESKETEDLKHEKIADLLDLFKEPLTLRQENFLKNALEQLSDAIGKEKVFKNVSLCENIEKSKSLLNEENDKGVDLNNENKESVKCKLTPVEKKTAAETKNEAASEAIAKLNNVMNLINKFQQVHKTLSALKKPAGYNNKNDNVLVPERKLKTDTKLTNYETVELNMFGKILEKFTKLLMPPKRSKNFVKNIKNHNIFANNNDVQNILKSVYNVDVSNSSLTAKDKVILDYLNIVKKNPKCILNNHHDVPKSFPNVEGNILLNLSEFIKINSFGNLLKLLKPEIKRTRSDDVTTNETEVTTTQWTTIAEVTSTRHSAKLTKTKEKLKGHLKSIIEDLRELQVAKGFPASNLSIADTLPCIYNILNSDKVTQQKLLKKVPLTPGEKVTAIFNSLKRDFMTVPTRRAGVITGPRPKSAIVWERIVTNFNGRAKGKEHTRRTMDYKEPKSIEELIKTIDELKESSNTYKSNIVLKGVEPAKRLLLLKTLFEEVKKYIAIIESINNSVVDIKKMSADNQNDLRDFVYNAAKIVNLNSKVANSINKFTPGSTTNGDIDIFNPTPRAEKLAGIPLRKQSLRTFDIPSSKKDITLTRDEIINQLIKNRMKIYIAAKESKGQDLINDINYSIAKKVLTYLEMGSYSLARELYKYIVNQNVKSEYVSNEHTVVAPFKSNIGIKRSYGFSKEPLIQFEVPTPHNQMQLINHDLWLRQLMNLKRI